MKPAACPLSVVLFAALAACGKGKADADAVLDKRIGYAHQVLSKGLTEGMTQAQVETFFQSTKQPFETKLGCVGNLGLSPAECSEGKTFIGSLAIPETEGGNSASIFVFVHSSRGVLSFEVASAEPH